MLPEFRYRRLGYVALNVSDLERSAAHYQNVVGLQPAGEAQGDARGKERLFRCSERHHDVVLGQGGQPGLRRIGWEMEGPEHTSKIRKHLAGLGIDGHDVSAEECASLGIHDAFRITEPNTGATFEYFSKLDEAETPFVPTVAKIVRLGHIVLNVANHPEAERFFLEQLNFRASDRIDKAVTFMRCFPNPLHHSLGLSNNPAKNLHHVNLMVTEVDDIGKAIWRMKKNDVPVVFGPGRHPPSDSMFFYFLDPDQITLEYSFGMEEFPETGARDPRLMPLALESIDYWGGAPTPQMAKVGVIEQLGAAEERTDS